MQLQIRGKNVKVSDERRILIEKKLGKLNHYLETINEATVELAAENSRRDNGRLVVEMTVRTNGTLLRAEERDSDLSNALDRVHDKMQRQMTRYKERQIDRKRRPSSATANANNDDSETPVVSLPETDKDSLPVKVKSFEVAPMLTSDAIDQMELLGHDFFVFLDADTKDVNVVYRRDDGYYGLLKPAANRS